MNNIMSTLQTGIMMMLMIQYASYDNDSAIRFLAILIGVSILKLLVKEWNDDNERINS